MLRHPELPFRALLLFIVSLFMWDILFSPFGLERRILDPAVIVLVAALKEWMERTRADASFRPVETAERDDGAVHGWMPTHA
jgi:hypothetical protein